MLKIGEKILSRQDIYRYFGSLQQIAGLKRFTYSEGKAKGLEAVECRSGNGLRFVILLDRGMDIGLCEYKGIPIAFRSPTGESFPSFFEAPRYRVAKKFWRWAAGNMWFNLFRVP